MYKVTAEINSNNTWYLNPDIAKTFQRVINIKTLMRLFFCPKALKATVFYTHGTSSLWTSHTSSAHSHVQLVSTSPDGMAMQWLFWHEELLCSFLAPFLHSEEDTWLFPTQMRPASSVAIGRSMSEASLSGRDLPQLGRPSPSFFP